MSNDLDSSNSQPTKSSFGSVDFAELEQITDEFLDFSAIDEGVGFHSKKQINRAEKEERIEQLTVRTRENIRTSAQKAAEKRASSYSPSIQEAVTNPTSLEVPSKSPALNAAGSSTLNQSSKATHREPGSIADTSTDFESASFSSRSMAMLFDLLIINVPNLCVFAWLVPVHSMATKSLGYFLILQFFLTISYLIFTEALGGQSLGKALFGLQVLENDRYLKPIGLGQALLRTFGWLLAISPVGLALFFLFWRSNYAVWHDMVSHSVVAKTR